MIADTQTSQASQAAAQTVAMVMSAAAFNADTDRALCTGPAYHAAPLAFNLQVPMLAGLPVHLMDRFDAEEMLRLVEKHRITHTHMVPTMFHWLLALPEDVRASYDVSSLRFVPVPRCRARCDDRWGRTLRSSKEIPL